MILLPGMIFSVELKLVFEEEMTNYRFSPICVGFLNPIGFDVPFAQPIRNFGIFLKY